MRPFFNDTTVVSRNIFCSSLALVLLLVVALPGVAKEIRVVTDSWKGYSNRDGAGYYLDILRAAFPPPEYSLNINYVPFRRSLRMVEAAQADIVLGVNSTDIDADLIANPVVENDAVDLLLHKELARNWQGLRSLEYKKIAAKRGYGFDVHFNFPIDYHENNTLLGMMKMLSVGRIDAILDYEADIKNMWKESGLDEDFIIIKAVLVSKAFFAFSRDQQGLKKHFEEKFPELLQSGKIYEIGKLYGIEESQLP